MLRLLAYDCGCVCGGLKILQLCREKNFGAWGSCSANLLRKLKEQMNDAIASDVQGSHSNICFCIYLQLFILLVGGCLFGWLLIVGLFCYKFIDIIYLFGWEGVAFFLFLLLYATRAYFYAIYFHRYSMVLLSYPVLMLFILHCSPTAFCYFALCVYVTGGML